MKILVEGPDASGKSTLVEILKTELQLPVIHLTNETPDVTEGIKFYQSLGDCILDRGILSTYVYSKVFKDTRMPSLEEVEDILNLIDYVVLCLPFDYAKYENHFLKVSKERKELYNTMKEIYNEFLKLKYILRKKFYVYDIFSSLQTPNGVLRHLKGF